MELILDYLSINPAARVCPHQDGRVSAELSVPGGLVSGPGGADGVLARAPGCGRA